MRVVVYASVLLYVLYPHKGFSTAMVWNRTCGRDLTKSKVYEGMMPIEKFPWMGILYYTKNKYRVTTVVVLVTKQMVLGSAKDIELMPKHDFRTKSLVVLGGKCGVRSIKIRDYSFHPEYYSGRTNTLALVQLETDHVKQELRPICAPFAHFIKPEFYAMSIVDDCSDPQLSIHKMEFVNTNQCAEFYMKSGLNHSSIWPSHVVCARSKSNKMCVWRSGSVLITKQYGRWGLLGFSVHGPGCGAPSRFIDYGKYNKWVRRSVATVGHPAVTRLDSNLIILRRSFSNLQRFGPCDDEEMRYQLYKDNVRIISVKSRWDNAYYARYNVTIVESVEYSCVVFHARLLSQDELLYKLNTSVWHATMLDPSKLIIEKPLIRLQRWCSSPGQCNFDFRFVEINFFVQLLSSRSTQLQVIAYGKKSEIINVTVAKRFDGKLPIIPDADHITMNLKKHRGHNRPYKWFDLYDVGPAYGYTKNRVQKFRYEMEKGNL